MKEHQDNQRLLSLKGLLRQVCQAEQVQAIHQAEAACQTAVTASAAVLQVCHQAQGRQVRHRTALRQAADQVIHRAVRRQAAAGRRVHRVAAVLHGHLAAAEADNQFKIIILIWKYYMILYYFIENKNCRTFPVQN
jgi:hypothetical protein